MVSNKNTVKQAMIVFGVKELEKDARIGMSSVDPMDIRPPNILLVQAKSDESQFVDENGTRIKEGNFFHTGKLKGYANFECYLLYAEKSQYIDRRKPEKGKQDQYKVIGAMADDLSLFGMTFKSSSIYALSGLFTAVTSRNRPMYSIKVKIEQKKLQNDKGEWFIPVLRIQAEELDYSKLEILSKMAKKLDSRGQEMPMQDEDEEAEIAETVNESLKENSDSKSKEDIPF
jgi:hypothetical protein